MSTSPSPRARSWPSWARPARASRPCCTAWPASSGPTRGEVRFAGRRIDDLGEHDRTVLRREQFGFLFQFGQLVPELPAVENVALPLLLAGRRRPDAVAEADRWFARLGIDDLQGRRPGELSGGQAQRVALARALVTAPAVLFADEPTGSLDSLAGERVMDLLVDTARAAGTTVVLVTHEAAHRRLRRPRGRRPGRPVHDPRRCAGDRPGRPPGRERRAGERRAARAHRPRCGHRHHAPAAGRGGRPGHPRPPAPRGVAVHRSRTRPTSRATATRCCGAGRTTSSTAGRWWCCGWPPPARARPVPLGLAHVPRPGEVYVSPPLAQLMDELPADRLADRFPAAPSGHVDRALPGGARRPGGRGRGGARGAGG